MGLTPKRFELLLRGHKAKMRLIIGGAGARIAQGQGRGAFEIGLRQTHLRFLPGDVALQASIVLLGRLQSDAGLLQIGLRHADRDIELFRVKAEQDLPRLDRVALMHVDGGDEARNIGRHHQLAGAHIGVVS